MKKELQGIEESPKVYTWDCLEQHSRKHKIGKLEAMKVYMDSD